RRSHPRMLGHRHDEQDPADRSLLVASPSLSRNRRRRRGPRDAWLTAMSVEASGRFQILRKRSVHRLGFGAMRITGPGIRGPPVDRESAVATLRRARDLGIDLFDTADSYGPFISEDLICETLHPYTGLLVATKGGYTRHGPDIWAAVGR